MTSHYYIQKKILWTDFGGCFQTPQVIIIITERVFISISIFRAVVEIRHNWSWQSWLQVISVKCNHSRITKTDGLSV